MSARLALGALAAVVACSGAQRRARPVLPVCAGGIAAGLNARALAWTGDGWGAVIPEGRVLYLREFAVDGAERGERVAVAEEPSTPARVGVAWAAGAYYVAVAPARGETPTRVFRATRADGGDGEAFAVAEALTGELDVVARDDVPAQPAALFFEDARGVSMRRLARDGAPQSPHRCPADVHPRAVVAWRDGFRALAARADAATGEVRAVDLVALDDDCEVAWRTPVWQGDVNGRVHSLAVDDAGAVVAFGDREGGAWIAGADHRGIVRIRTTRMERRARSPRVFVQTDASGRRLGIQVAAVRTIETGDQLAVWRLDPDGLLRDVHTLAASPEIELVTSVPDAWGGGLVAFTREETTRGSARAGAGAYGFFARVCP